MRSNFEPFSVPERPCRIEKYAPARSADATQCFMWLLADHLPTVHLERCFGAQMRRFRGEHGYNQCFGFDSPDFPPGFESLVSLLATILSLPAPAPFDLALALDRYKVVDDSVPPTQWQNTEAGELVYRAKYFVNSPTLRKAARDALVAKLAYTILNHPAYTAAPYLLSVPGSAGDGKSTGEQVAAAVATATGKRLVQTYGPPRPQRKAEPDFDVSGLFTLPTMLDAPCVVVDDVWRSGKTICEVARVAKLAGAPAVYGLAAARTMRN